MLVRRALAFCVVLAGAVECYELFRLITHPAGGWDTQYAYAISILVGMLVLFSLYLASSTLNSTNALRVVSLVLGGAIVGVGILFVAIANYGHGIPMFIYSAIGFQFAFLWAAWRLAKSDT